MHSKIKTTCYTSYEFKMQCRTFMNLYNVQATPVRVED